MAYAERNGSGFSELIAEAKEQAVPEGGGAVERNPGVAVEGAGGAGAAAGGEVPDAVAGLQRQAAPDVPGDLGVGHHAEAAVGLVEEARVLAQVVAQVMHVHI